jgi:hypothetical protein
MRFYRVHRYNGSDGSFGYEFYTNRREADEAARKWQANDGDGHLSTPEEIEIAPTKAAILAALRDLASHPNNG